jgi:DNA invertase Pin-like site-specific DNA recombinase
MKVYGYIRVSGRGQMDGDGPERQETAIRLYCVQHNLDLVSVFIESTSGTNDLEDRAEFQRMRDFLGQNMGVVVEKLDRLARDLMIQEQFVADLQRNGVTLYSTQEPDLCSKDPARILVRQIMGAFAQYDRAMIVSRLRGARQRIRARGGRCEGRSPYGYKIAGDKGQKALHPIASEQEVIKQIRVLRDSGSNIYSITSWLNASQFKPRGGTQWHPQQVVRILDRSTGS